MKTKILLLGTNNAVINDFFRQMDEMFEMQTSSLRYDDILGHAKYFKPQAMIYCLHSESRDDISLMVSIQQRLRNQKLPLIIIGNQEDCDNFNKITGHLADLVLEKPITTDNIRYRIGKFLKNRLPSASQKAQEQNTDMNQSFVASASTAPEPAAKPDPMMNQVADIISSLDVPSAKAAKPASEQAVPVHITAPGMPVTPSPAMPGMAEEPARKHILVVDDDVRMLKVIKRHLDSEYDIATAINGTLALRFLKKKSTDLILLDYEMPDEKGPDVLKKIRENDATKNIPVLFLTGAAERGKIQKALALKPQGYLLKPVERDALLARIKELIG